ncbi:hypothetical protein Pst134EA_003268 [Puccinia striiformis f. sp. tritici]|uniref:hypothetical protein n=1 Tax=Puccinia striiformis f. sp. tritici TaxID=168172 RepID=UPI002007B4D5|nr:hypothetical protein Pst134EA_003268 [Puccinia striiformis f. sp. tritici]KAH9472664.1 hypothetical protein Pst134EA_003268 [Puccinia striiformis f. sp. tritici]
MGSTGRTTKEATGFIGPPQRNCLGLNCDPDHLLASRDLPENSIQDMATNTDPWICVFGSNLFHQLDPDDTRTNLTKKIIHPRQLEGTRILKDGTSVVEVLHVTDSQTLVYYNKSGGNSASGSSYLELWGFDEENQSSSLKDIRDRLDPTHYISHSIDQVKQWLGTNKILGYLATDGTINSINFKATNESREKIKRHVPSDPARYQALTISDNGEVLAALSPEFSRTLEPQNGCSAHRLELWPSLQELMDFLLDINRQPGSKTRLIYLKDPPAGETEIRLSSGASHFLIMTHTPSTKENCDYSSTLYTFGDNRFGQLGIGTRSVSVTEPQKIENLPALIKIDCGLFHSVAVGQDGELYTFGHNRKGQCGVGSSEIDTSTPVLVDLGGNGEAGDIIDVIDACCGSEHTAVLTSSGVWLAGCNTLGQLGMGDLVSRFEFHRNENITIAGNHPSEPAAWKIQTGRWSTYVWKNP